MLLTPFVFGISALRCVFERIPEKFVTETIPACSVPSASTICAADIGRNNGVCSDPEISLLTADGQQPRISGKLAMLPPRTDRYIGLSYTLYLRFITLDFLFVCSNEMRDMVSSSCRKCGL